jgi:hypothetical protein
MKPEEVSPDGILSRDLLSSPFDLLPAYAGKPRLAVSQEMTDRDTAVKLAEAAGQAVWGSAYHTIATPGGIKAAHLSLLSHMALHTIE